MQANVTADLNHVAKNVKVEVRIRTIGVTKFRLRMALMTGLLKLAALVSPFDMRVFADVTEPFLFYCPFCGRDVSCNVIMARAESVSCSHCGRQSVVKHGDLIHDEPCPGDYECGIAEPYGFVPEAGCPVHDG